MAVSDGMDHTTMCALCGIEEKIHLAAEEAHAINHRWTTSEEILPPRTKAKPQPPRQAVSVVSIDSELRRVLLAKGIISAQDFSTVLDSGSSSS